MLDFSRLAETVTGLLGGAGAASQADAGGVLDVLAEAGITPAMLEGLDQNGILDLLAQYGIDPSQLAESQITELLGQFGGFEQAQAMLESFSWSDGAGRE